MNVDLDDGASMRATMERALQDVHAPAGLGHDAVAIGRRLRTRRRLGVAAGAAMGVAAVAVIAAPHLGEGGGKAIDDTGLASTPSASTPLSTSGVPGTADADPNDPWPNLDLPEGWWDMPADQMLAALEAHLPTGVTIKSHEGSSEVDNGPGTLTVVVSGPTGTGLVSILLQPPPLEELPPPVTSTDADGNEHVAVFAEAVPYGRRLGCRPAYLACELIRDATGVKVGDVSTEIDAGTTYHNGDLIGPEGGAINVYVADSTGEKPGYEPPTAEGPLLTFEQVRELIEDPIWTSYQP